MKPFKIVDSNTIAYYSTGNIKIEESHSSINPGASLWPISFHILPIQEFLKHKARVAFNDALATSPVVPIDITLFIKSVAYPNFWLDSSRKFSNYSAFCRVFHNSNGKFAIRHPTGMLMPNVVFDDVLASRVERLDEWPDARFFVWQIAESAVQTDHAVRIWTDNLGVKYYWALKNSDLILQNGEEKDGGGLFVFVPMQE